MPPFIKKNYQWLINATIMIIIAIFTFGVYAQKMQSSIEVNFKSNTKQDQEICEMKELLNKFSDQLNSVENTGIATRSEVAVIYNVVVEGKR